PPGYGGIPPYPGLAVVKPYALPNPPQLDPVLSDMDRVLWLVKAYQGAVLRRYQRKAYVFGGGRPRGVGGSTKTKPTRDALATPPPTMRELWPKSKMLPGLIESAHALIQHHIAPAGWVSFSIDVWRAYATKRQAADPPPVSWCYSTARMEDNHGW